MAKRIGKQTIIIEKNVGIISSAGVVGKKEYEGPLGKDFDNVFLDEYAGEESFEAAESKFLKNAIGIAMLNKELKVEDIDIVTGGDLLNQDMASTFGVKDFQIPYIGLFSACSSCSLGAGLASVIIDSGAANTAIAATSSHFCSAERQFRFPLEYGSKTTPNSQRTVTGAGAGVFAIDKSVPNIKAVTFGKVVDFGVTDANNMGAAMAPAAADTISQYFEDTGSKPDDFDLILTGDLGFVGSKILLELLSKKGFDISVVHNDCGMMMFGDNDPDYKGGGSGCGCCASIFYSHIMKKFHNNELRRILVIATGALLSPTSAFQGFSIPAIAHLIEVEKC